MFKTFQLCLQSGLLTHLTRDSHVIHAFSSKLPESISVKIEAQPDCVNVIKCDSQGEEAMEPEGL